MVVTIAVENEVFFILHCRVRAKRANSLKLVVNTFMSSFFNFEDMI